MFHLFAGTVASFESVSVPVSASYQSQTKLFFFSPGNLVSLSWFVIYLGIWGCIQSILAKNLKASVNSLIPNSSFKMTGNERICLYSGQQKICIEIKIEMS